MADAEIVITETGYEIAVSEVTYAVEVPEDIHTIEVAAVGPPGPPGPAGDVSTQAYRHIQQIAAAQWVIVHPLQFRPSVTVVDSASRHVIPGEIVYTDDQTVTLNFSAAFGGEAYLS